jgi:hypothetical protein
LSLQGTVVMRFIVGVSRLAFANLSRKSLLPMVVSTSSIPIRSCADPSTKFRKSLFTASVWLLPGRDQSSTGFARIRLPVASGS